MYTTTNRFLKRLHPRKCFMHIKKLTTKLVYSNFGNPLDVINKVTDTTPEPSRNEVLIEMLAAPINPVDINIIQGKYPYRKPFPAVAGYEGAGKIIKLGEDVDEFKVGDHVIPLQYNLGTWSTHMVLTTDILKKIPTDLPPTVASILMINPPTVYRMLKDYVELQKSDVVIQNAANSSCGQLVVQLCKHWGIKTVNVVRNRDAISELKEELKELGATYVLTEEELRTTELFKSGEVKKPLLGLNAVGGKSALELVRHLDAKGLLLTYGGMSMQPINIPVSLLIFKDVRFKGFNVNFWNTNCDANERDRMIDELVSLLLKGDLRAPKFVTYKIDEYKVALSDGLSSKSKNIFDFTK